MKKLLSIFLTVSLLASYQLATYADHLPNDQGYCGTCVEGAFPGDKCECTLDKEKWVELGYTTARCARNVLDPNPMAPWLCQLHGFGQ